MAICLLYNGSRLASCLCFYSAGVISGVNSDSLFSGEASHPQPLSAENLWKENKDLALGCTPLPGEE